MYIIKKRIKRKKTVAKKMKRNMLMVGLSLALAGQTSMAADRQWTLHENEWKNVIAYGKTPISEDSGNKWGPWTEFVQPAAGLLPVAMLPQIPTDGTQYFRPESAKEYSPRYTLRGQEPPAPPVEEFCRSGEWCGYTEYTQWEVNYQEEYSTNIGPEPGRIALRLTPDDPNIVTLDGGEGSGKVSFRVKDLPCTKEVYESCDCNVFFENGLSNFYDENYDYDGEHIDGRTPLYGYISDGNGHATFGSWASRWYVDGGEGEIQGRYIAGIATPLADMNSLRAGDVTAIYRGRTLNTYSPSPVQIEVKFGPGTWSGSWNNGMDGSTYTWTDSRGKTYVTGQVGFNAKGTIDGVNIKSTNLSATDGTVSGKVQGNFFGPKGAVLGGVSDITKTKSYIQPTRAQENGYGYKNARSVDVFVTCKNGCPD